MGGQAVNHGVKKKPKDGDRGRDEGQHEGMKVHTRCLCVWRQGKGEGHTKGSDGREGMTGSYREHVCASDAKEKPKDWEEGNLASTFHTSTSIINTL